MKNSILFLLVFFQFEVYSQKTSIEQLVRENHTTFSFANNHFSGKGWSQLIHEIKKHQNIAIGEDHFFNEIPIFISQIIKEVKFDNFFCEIDPYSAHILENKIATLSSGALNLYIKEFGSALSFFGMTSEFELLTNLVKNKVKIFGTDQILLFADRLIFSEIKANTSNQNIRKICEIIERQSKVHFENFIAKKGTPYFYTNEFKKQLEALKRQSLTSNEKEVIEAMELSIKIYLEEDEKLRMQLMKHLIMKNYSNIVRAKNMFKYGAYHLPKGESLLKNYDIGNLVSNISDSQFNESLHIMVLAKSGVQGVPYKVFPKRYVRTTSDVLKPFQVFFNSITDNEQWYVFDVKNIRKQIANKQLVVFNENLSKVIKGYDYLVVLPNATPAKFVY